MVDTAYDDFLDSDDDAFFLEASHHLLDYDSVTESTQISEKNASEEQSQINTLLHSDLNSRITSTEIQNNVPNTNKFLSKESEAADKNTGGASKSSESNGNDIPGCSKMPMKECKNVIEDNLNESRISEINSDALLYSPRISPKESVKDIVSAININASTSSECDSSLNKTSVTPSSSSYINNRFTPGFTPKARKRKFPGPAGFFEQFSGSQETKAGSSEEVLDMEFENVVSSQFTPEHLSLISWQKLQTAVSSCPNLHSTVKYYSIQRVLQESSKKKLPKHMVVPVLCVLLKKINCKGSAAIPVFMDDTGEINGKIDTEVLSTYKEFLVEGTALILKKVTFLCNVLILKSENLVSLYHPNGTEKHPQSLDSILKTPEPLKPMNCECLRQAHHNIKDGKHKITSDRHKSDCTSHSQSRLNNISNQNKIIPKLLHKNIPSKSNKPSYVNYNQNRLNTVSNQRKVVNNNMPNLTSGTSHHISEASNQSTRSDAFLENLLNEDNCIDEFDELLGNLDEKSFMEDI